MDASNIDPAVRAGLSVASTYLEIYLEDRRVRGAGAAGRASVMELGQRAVARVLLPGAIKDLANPDARESAVPGPPEHLAGEFAIALVRPRRRQIRATHPGALKENRKLARINPA
jgi:hypothetical protein